MCDHWFRKKGAAKRHIQTAAQNRSGLQAPVHGATEKPWLDAPIFWWKKWFPWDSKICQKSIGFQYPCFGLAAHRQASGLSSSSVRSTTLAGPTEGSYSVSAKGGDMQGWESSTWVGQPRWIRSCWRWIRSCWRYNTDRNPYISIVIDIFIYIYYYILFIYLYIYIQFGDICDWFCCQNGNLYHTAASEWWVTMSMACWQTSWTAWRWESICWIKCPEASTAQRRVSISMWPCQKLTEREWI